MDQALVRFEQYVKRRFGHSSTLKHYRSDLKIFIHTINNNNKSPEAVIATDLDVFIDQQIVCGLSPTTINRRPATALR